jgi:hypothetical protein
MDELNNFAEIEGHGSLNTNLILSNVYSIRIGGFGNDSSIKTYLTTLKIDELENDVSFYETLSNEKDWPVSQIIQREVDKIRVNSITKKYLLGKGRDIKYFPPIIVALLPRNPEGDFSKEYNYQVDQTDETKEVVLDKSKYRGNQKFKELFIPIANSSLVDGMFLYEDSKVFEHSLLSWDKSKFYAVVIDGQHRLNALLKSKEEDHSFANAIQDVIFLDVSHLVKEKKTLSPVEVLRTIFIDINTNAKSVSLVRRVLIDDKDLSSLCVQSLVDSVNLDGSTKLKDKFIPSILIDWHGESLKHELPHITGVLGIFQIISDELITDRLITIDDHRNHQKIKRFIELLNGYFFVDKTIKGISEFSDVIPLEKSLTDYFDDKKINREIFSEELQDDDLIDSILFNYDYRVLEVAKFNFDQLYLRAIKNIFCEFTPYKNVISIIEAKDGFNPRNVLYKTLLSPKSKIAKTFTYKDAYVALKTELLNSEIITQNNLFYMVVGQKAIFKLFFERLFIDFAYGINEEFVLKIQKEFTKEINCMLKLLAEGKFYLFGKDEIGVTEKITMTNKDILEYGTIASSFWEGILLEDKRVIYNSQGVRAIADVIILVLECIKQLKNDGKINLTNYTIRYSTQRTKRLLKKRFGNRSDEEFEKIAKQILNIKKQFIIERLGEFIQSK